MWWGEAYILSFQGQVNSACMEFVDEGQRGLLQPGFPFLPQQFIQHFAVMDGILPTPACPTGSCPLYLLNMTNKASIYGFQTGAVCIKLGTHKRFVCSFYGFFTCQASVLAEKIEGLSISSLEEISDMLTLSIFS